MYWSCVFKSPAIYGTFFPRFPRCAMIDGCIYLYTEGHNFYWTTRPVPFLKSDPQLHTKSGGTQDSNISIICNKGISCCPVETWLPTNQGWKREIFSISSSHLLNGIYHFEHRATHSQLLSLPSIFHPYFICSLLVSPLDPEWCHTKCQPDQHSQHQPHPYTEITSWLCCLDHAAFFSVYRR